MNYKAHYDKLINRSKNRQTLGQYVEKHHIIPKCMGGPDCAANLVNLSAEEHFVAHQLLVKMYPFNKKLLLALTKMCSSSRKNVRRNKIYGWIRKRWSESFSGENHPLARITNDVAVEIYHSDEDPDILSDRFNIDRYTVLAIKRKIVYSCATKNISDLPGFYFGGKTTRLPLPIDSIEKILYDTGDYSYFWKKYRATERVVKSIKDKKSFKSITSVLGIPGQVKRYGMTRDTIEKIFNASGSNKEIAKQFGIHYNTVRNIKGKNSRAWHMWEGY